MSSMQDFRVRKEALLNMLNESKQFLDERNSKEIDSHIESLEKNEFQIVVVGEFSAGKSTFLNALMGERYLPSFSKETTATINYLKHISKSKTGKGLEVVFKDVNQPIAYGEATRTDIERYVSTSSSEVDVVQNVKHVNLYLESDFLQDGVILVDSPGLNGIAEGHREVTESQIDKSHACIYMFHASQAGKQTDFDILKGLVERFETIFLVINQIDKIKAHEETVEDVVENLKQNYVKYFPDTKGVPEIFPVAAYPALVARTIEKLEYPDSTGQIEHSAEDRAKFIKASRIEQFEERLLRFITTGQKAKEQFLTPAHQVGKQLVDVRTQIEQDLESLQGQIDVADIKAEQDRLHAEEKEMRKTLQNEQATVTQEVKEIIEMVQEQLKSKSIEIEDLHSRNIKNWDNLDDVEEVIDKMQNSIVHDFEGVIVKIADGFQESIQDLIQTKYTSYVAELTTRVDDLGAVATYELNNPKKIVFDTSKLESSLQSIKAEEKEMKKEIENILAEIDHVQQNRLQVELYQMDKERLEEELRDVRERQYTIENSLGPRPSSVQREETEFVKEKRTGLFGIIGNALVGAKSVQRPKFVTDDSQQVEYDKQKKERLDLIRKDEDAVRERMSEMRRVEGSTQQIELEYQQLQRQLDRIKQERKEAQEEAVKQFQKDNARLLRKYQMEMSDYIDAVREEFEKTIKKEMKDKRKVYAQTIIDVISLQIQEEFDRIETRQKELVEILNSSAQEIEQKKQQASEQIEKINNLLQQVFQFRKQIEAIPTDVIKREVLQSTQL